MAYHMPRESGLDCLYLAPRLLQIVFSEIAHSQRYCRPYPFRIDPFRDGNEPHLSRPTPCLLTGSQYSFPHGGEGFPDILHERMPKERRASVISQMGRPTTLV